MAKYQGELTDRARLVIELAQAEAFAMGHPYVGTEHLLLGIMAEAKGVGVQALAELGVDRPLLQAKIIEVLRRG